MISGALDRGDPPVPLQNVMTDLTCGFAESLCGPVVLVDYAAEDLPTLYRRGL